MTPPMIAPVLFDDGLPLLVMLLPPFVSFAGPSPIEGVIGTDALPTDASVDLDDDENALVVTCVIVGVVGDDNLSEAEPESVVGEMR